MNQEGTNQVQLILVVDSLEERRLSIVNHLLGLGLAVVGYRDALESLRCAKESVPALILIAENNSGIPANVFLSIRQKIPDLIDTPVLVYAAKKEETCSILQMEAEDVVTEPLDLTEIELRVKRILRRGFRRGVSGSLVHFPLLMLLQMILSSRLSGRMTVDLNLCTGTLDFRLGQIIWAVAEGEEGEYALQTIIDQGRRGGQFTFCAGDTRADDVNISRPTDHLLLEIASSLDERNAE